MDLLYNNNLINQIVDKLFKHRRSDYSEFNLENILNFTDIIHEVHRVPNQNYQKIYASLFKKKQDADICIIFMHGYGSNRLQCSSLLRSFNSNYALCAFDFSGSGKSEGDLVTYGMKEKQDINSIINYLRKTGFKKFILWGRSMGATSALLYCIKYHPQDVILQIIDSPFYSFELIAFEIANKNVKAPEFIISFALQLAKKNCGKFEFNPFEIQLKDVGECTVPALFIYSQEDNVINCQNTHMICGKYKAVYEKLVIEENHNTIRTPATIEKIYSFIQKYSKVQKNKQNSSLTALNDMYFDTKSSSRTQMTPIRKMYGKGDRTEQQSNQKNRSIRRGIERVNAQHNTSCKKFDDYGIWVASKFKNEPQTPQSTINRRKDDSVTKKRPHLSLSNSLAAKPRQIDTSIAPSFLREEPSRQSANIYQFKTMASQKQRSNKKISTIKSLGVSRCLNNSKYL